MDNPTNLSTPHISRRTLITAGALAGAAIGGATACTTGGADQRNRADANAKARLPAYQSAELIKPDLPGDQVVMPGYYAYPTDPKPAFERPPGANLGTISIHYPTFIATPPGPDRNSFYAQLQQDIGAELAITAIPAADYTAKFQTTIAGGNLPDIMMFPLPTPDQPRLMERLFADLGPYLAGAASKDFPFLANIPTDSWRPTISNGTIYAVPQPRSIAGRAIYLRQDLVTELGVNTEPADYAEFVELLKAVTDPRKNRWAISNALASQKMIAEMLEAPNGWNESGGTFTSAWGDERTKQSILRVAELVKQDLFHPDSASVGSTEHRDLFFGGRTVVLSDGYAGWDLFVRQLGGAEEGVRKLGFLITPKFNGGGDAPHYAGSVIQALTVIKKGLGEDKTRAILNVLNFLAAPIGSREHLRRKYGVEGKDFTWENGLPMLTQEGQTNFMDLQYIVDAPTIIGPGVTDGVDRQHAWHTRVTKRLVRDPSFGLYSETASRKGAATDRALNDVMLGVIFGRNTIADYDDAYAHWRTEGGDAIAAEFGAALEAAGR